MTSISPATKVSSKTVADDFVAVVTHLMKSSSAPMVEFVERHDLNFTQMKLMFTLANSGEPQPIGRLAEMTGASLPAAGRAVDGLVRSGLATRTEDPADRRVKRIEVTPLGNEGIQEINESRLATLSAVLDNLEPDQLAALAAAIEPLRELTLGADCSHPNETKEVSR